MKPDIRLLAKNSSTAARQRLRGRAAWRNKELPACPKNDSRMEDVDSGRVETKDHIAILIKRLELSIFVLENSESAPASRESRHDRQALGPYYGLVAKSQILEKVAFDVLSTQSVE
jgi:hypothetical protein